ncbi:MAG: SDR family NAD(P)-dependent oxidoreductase, partial [Flavobacteriales bacterium]
MVLITGATGLIGAHIALELMLANKKVRALKRSTSSLEGIKSLFEKNKQKVLWDQIEWVEGDVTDITTLDEAFKDVKEVYHIAGRVSFDDRESKELYEVNIKGTANMINFSILNGVERFLYMSSIAVMDSINN